MLIRRGRPLRGRPDREVRGGEDLVAARKVHREKTQAPHAEVEAVQPQVRQQLQIVQVSGDGAPGAAGQRAHRRRAMPSVKKAGVVRRESLSAISSGSRPRPAWKAATREPMLTPMTEWIGTDARQRPSGADVGQAAESPGAQDQADPPSGEEEASSPAGRFNPSSEDRGEGKGAARRPARYSAPDGWRSAPRQGRETGTQEPAWRTRSMNPELPGRLRIVRQTLGWRGVTFLARSLTALSIRSLMNSEAGRGRR